MSLELNINLQNIWESGKQRFDEYILLEIFSLKNAFKPRLINKIIRRLRPLVSLIRRSFAQIDRVEVPFKIVLIMTIMKITYWTWRKAYFDIILFLIASEARKAVGLSRSLAIPQLRACVCVCVWRHYHYKKYIHGPRKLSPSHVRDNNIVQRADDFLSGGFL